MSTIRKLRRDTYATLLGVTGSEDEIGYASDKGRLVFFDGVTAGPTFILPTVTDVLLNNFTVAVCSGTDTLTASLLKAPAAYATYMQVLIIPANDNTGAVTLNLNGLGEKDVKKMGASGLAALDGGDLKAGGAYPAVYDGTRFIVIGGTAGSGGGSWVPINTTTASGASAVDFAGLLNSTYDTYMIVGEKIVPSTTQDIYVRVGYGGTPTYVSATYTSVGWSVASNAASGMVDQNGVNSAYVAARGVAAVTCAFEMIVDNTQSTSLAKPARASSMFGLGAGHVQREIRAGLASDTNAINNALTSLRVLPSTGTFSGVFTLFGLRRAT